MPKVILSIPRAGSIGAMTGIVSGWAKGGALEEEIIEFNETSYAFNVTRCMYAERYRQLGMEEFGYCLSCCRDEPFAQGFNADIRFEQKQTIMEGAPHCRLKCDNEITPTI